jgi:hypothetical protein
MRLEGMRSDVGIGTLPRPCPSVVTETTTEPIAVSRKRFFIAPLN